MTDTGLGTRPIASRAAPSNTTRVTQPDRAGQGHPLSQRTLPYGWFVLLLGLDVLVLLIEKTAAMNAIGMRAYYAALLSQPWVWASLALGPVQLFVWMRILARTELSLAYPISSLSYPLAMWAAQLAFREQLSRQVWIGALLITLGVALVGSTSTMRRSAPAPGHA